MLRHLGITAKRNTVFVPQAGNIGADSIIWDKEVDMRMPRASNAAEAVLDQIDTMNKTILTCAFRGELGPNDPAEE